MTQILKRFLAGCIPALVLISCGNQQSAPGRLEVIRHSDSAVVMYYHTPGDPRFFNLVKVKNMDSLQPVAEDVNQRPAGDTDRCATQGKIYFYGKAGAVYPVYFTRERTCMRFSFIVTGVKYYAFMSGASLQVLEDMEKRVVKLSGRGD